MAIVATVNQEETGNSEYRVTAALYNKVATSHIWLLKLKLNKI